MADDALKTANVAQADSVYPNGIVSIAGKVIPLSNTPLQILYFDGAVSVSNTGGVIGITLVASGNVPQPNGGVSNVAGVVAHLKCNAIAANDLIGALQKALLLGAPVENPEGPAN